MTNRRAEKDAPAKTGKEGVCILMGYAENMYQWLKRNGYADKYDHAGIYCIKIDNIIVYIGKSTNMLRRVAEHYAAIKGQETRKYRILAEA